MILHVGLVIMCIMRTSGWKTIRTPKASTPIYARSTRHATIRGILHVHSEGAGILLDFIRSRKLLLMCGRCTFPTSRSFAQLGLFFYSCLSISRFIYFWFKSGASFMRKQDAVRHVNTMNSGKKYKCCVWLVAVILIV